MSDGGTAKYVHVDVAALPDHAFGSKGLIWWGTVGFMVIEGSMFVMVLVAYLVLRTRVGPWPPALPDPDVTLGTVNTVLFLASVVPNHLTKQAGERYELQRVRWLMPVMTAVGLAILAVRAFEFGSLNCDWSDGAYGSIVWTMLGLHTLHLATDTVDTGVLAALMFTRHAEPKRFVDVAENALYWDFVVVAWLPVYLTLYWGPRWL